MKDSDDKEHRISNLKNLIDNINEDEDNESIDELEEDSELINYLNEDRTDYDVLGIDDEYIYHPGNGEDSAINLEENPIDESYIINTPKTEDVEDTGFSELEELEELGLDFTSDISENFDNVINAKIAGKPILGIVSAVLGIIFIILSIFVFQSRSDRIIDNVVSGESNFLFIIFIAIGLFLLVYGIFRLFNLKHPFGNISASIDSIEKDNLKKKEVKKEEPEVKTVPKSKEPIDKESYKIGEFKMDDLKVNFKKSPKEKSPKEEVPKKESTEPGLITKEIEEIEYEQAKLDGESIDEIFAEIDDELADSDKK